MKGIIFLAIKELVKSRFGDELWNKICSEAGFDPKKIVLAYDVIDDDVLMNILKALSKHTGLSMQQLFDAFAEFWIFNYAPKYYRIYYMKAKNAKEFLKMMDEVHRTEAMKGLSDPSKVTPPRFRYEEPDGKTLIMHYESKRNLVDLAISLIKAVCRYYKEPCTVTRFGNTIKIVFQ